MNRLQPATATDAALDVWEKGRNDRNYDKAALFREKGPKHLEEAPHGGVWRHGGESCEQMQSSFRRPVFLL